MQKNITDIKTSELANALGKTMGFASQIKTGRRKIPAKDCVRVSKVLGIPLHALRPDIYPAD